MKPITNKPATKQTSVLQEEINSLIKNIDDAIAEQEFIKCIEAIRKGDESKIPDLVKSSELLILKAISHVGVTNAPLEKMISAANNSLTKLAYLNLNNKERDIYLRFCAFVIKQSVLKLKIATETNPNS